VTTSYPDKVSALDQRIGALAKSTPKVMGAYGQVVQHAMADGVLDTKTKELMALAIAVAIRCEDCIAYHTRAAIKQGAQEAEVLETLGVAVEMGGGPSVVYSARALTAYRELAS